MTRVLSINGTDFIAGGWVLERSVRYGPLDIGQPVSTLSFSTAPGAALPFTPDEGHYVFWTDTDGVTKRFSGHCRQPNVIVEGGKGSYAQIDCQDWGAILDQIRIAATLSYAANVSDRLIVEDLVARYYGAIATTGASHTIIASNTMMPAYTINAGVTLMRALSDLAAFNNGVPFWIDANKGLHWNDTFTAAPYSLTDDPTAGTTLVFSETVIADKPAGYWRLGEASGSSSADSSGNGHPATLVGSPALGTIGAVDDGNAAITLNGTSQYASVPDTASLRIAGDITLEAWVRATSFAAVGIVLMKGGAGNHVAGPYKLGINTNGTPFLARGNGAAEASVNCDVALSLLGWQLLAATMVGTTVTFYINGARAGATKTISQATADAGQPLRIGASNAPDQYLAAAIDEPAVWSSGLSASQIAAHFTAAGRLKTYIDLRDFTDMSQVAFRVRVYDGFGDIDVTVTDWMAVGAYALKYAAEPGAPTTRYHDIDDILDSTLQTAALATQEGWNKLRQRTPKRTLTVTTVTDGLYPGMRVDVFSAAIGTTGYWGFPVKPYIRTTNRNRARVYSGLGKQAELGVFVVRKVSPQPRVGNEIYRFRVEMNEYEPDLATTMSRML